MQERQQSYERKKYRRFPSQ